MPADRKSHFNWSGPVRQKDAGGGHSGEGGSVIIIVLITLLFASFALAVFLDKAGNDLLVEQRDAEARRLRREAYSALEVTLAVLEDFRLAGNGGLRSPAEGWGDPLTFAGYVPTEGRTIEIAFEDESGKISLPRTNAPVLTNLFKNWDLRQNDAEALADALIGWMKVNHVYATGLSPSYEQSTIPYLEPARSLRSYDELAAIDKVHDTFYDADGKPNELWKRFVDAVSLLDFQRPNINGAKPDTLAAVAQFDLSQQKNLADYLSGTGTYQTQGPGVFQNAGDAMRIAAGAYGDTSAFAPTISALRIFVTVHDGRSQFRLAAVVAPPNGATTIQTTATSQRAQASAASAGTAAAQQAQRNAAQGGNTSNPPTRQTTNASPNPANLRYPFTLLEIRENDEIPPPPPPPPESTL